MEEYISDFLDSLVNEGKSVNTVSAYQSDLNKFVDYLKNEDIKDLNDVTEIKLSSYFLSIEKQCSPRTLARNISAVKGLFKYLDRNRLIDADVGYNIKIPKVEAKAMPGLNNEEREALYNAITGDSVKALRDRVIISLLVDTKIKVSELIGIRFKDVNLVASYVLVVRYGKTNAVAIDGRVKENIILYLKQIGDIDSGSYLFISSKDKPFSRQGIWKMVRAYGKKAGIDKTINPEMLRRQD